MASINERKKRAVEEASSGSLKSKWTSSGRFLSYAIMPPLYIIHCSPPESLL